MHSLVKLSMFTENILINTNIFQIKIKKSALWWLVLAWDNSIKIRIHHFRGFVVTIAVSAVNIHHIPNNPKEPIMAEELCDLIATRTGIVTLYLVPLLVLFAGRNNFMQWLTGWKFSTYMIS